MTDKYTQYKLLTEHGVSMVVNAESATIARKDFEVAMPGIKLARIQPWKA